MSQATEWKWDSDLKEWFCNLEWSGGYDVEIYVSNHPEPPGETYLDTVKLQKQEWKEKAADEFLEMCNSEWNDEEDPFTRTEFINRMKLSLIVFYEGRSATIYFNDEDLFGGHSILVSLDEDGKVDDVDIAG